MSQFPHTSVIKPYIFVFSRVLEA